MNDTTSNNAISMEARVTKIGEAVGDGVCHGGHRRSGRARPKNSFGCYCSYNRRGQSGDQSIGRCE
jgi:hypothetical protein